MAYLDENGLEHFWGKIKDHVSSAVAPKADDADVVHKTGDELIQGVKTFENSFTSPSGNVNSNISLVVPNVESGVASENNNYASFGFLDSEGTSWTDAGSRLGAVAYKHASEADQSEFTYLTTFGYSGRPTTALSVGTDVDGIPFASAPETSDERTYSTDIVTRGYMEASEWNWQKTKKAGAVTLKPAPESDLDPVVDFMFTETPPVEGEKGPDNPSTITGVSSVKVARCGKNMITPYTTQIHTENQVTFTADFEAGTVTVNGTATGGSAFFSWGGGQTFLPKNETYTLSGCPAGGSLNTYSFRFSNGLYDEGSGKTFTPGSITQYFTIRIQEGTSVNNLVFKPQLELGSTATAFEPYEGNDYTIQLGGTYYGGSLDVATGVMTVTEGKLTLDSNANFVSSSGFFFENANTYVCSLYPTNAPIYTSAYSIPSSYASNKLPVVYANNPSTPAISLVGNSSVIRVSLAKSALGLGDGQSFATVSAAMKTWLGSNPIEFFYPLATPFTVQLTPTQIRSLPALDKYEPRINTIYTDQEAVQVGYQRYANYVDLTTDQTIDGEKLFRHYIRVKPKLFSVGYALFPCDTYAFRTDTLDSLATFDNSDKRLFLIRTIDKDSNGNRNTNIYAMPASGSILGSTALTIGLLDVDGASIGYAQAPGTPEYEADGVTKRTAGGDIVTRNWIPKDTRIVHTTGNETLYGQKTFKDAIYFSVAGTQAASYKVGILSCTSEGVRFASENSSSSSAGAYLDLHGKSALSNPGDFMLVSSGSSSKTLLGKPNGTFQWNGQNIQVSSDERLKTPILNISSDILDTWEDIQWGEFKYLEAVEEKGENARYHIGLIAQAVDRVFKDRGKDILKYGILCHDESEATEDEPARDLWTVRYTEALCMEAAYMRRENARLKKRVADLEERLAALELRLGSE